MYYFCLMRTTGQNKTFRDFVCQNVNFILKKQTNQNVSDGQLIWKCVLNTAKCYKRPATCHIASVGVPHMVMSAHTSHAKHQGKSSGWHVRNSFCKLQRLTMLDSFEHQTPLVITVDSFILRWLCAADSQGINTQEVNKWHCSSLPPPAGVYVAECKNQCPKNVQQSKGNNYAGQGKP